MIEFFEPVIPPRTGSKTNYRAVTKKSTGKTYVFKGERATAAMATWHEILKPHAPEKPMEGPLRLTIRLYFPLIGKDLNTKAKRLLAEQGVNYWMDSRPDAGNLCEAILDTMTKLLYFNDDAQVVDQRITKQRSSYPGVLIKLRGVEEWK